MTVPREIISEILKHLPVKILLRLRCVSKSWCSVIDDPLFVDLHHSFSQTRPGGINLLAAAFATICTVDLKGSHAIDILSLSELDHDHDHDLELNLQNPLDESEFVTPIQSINGLVCTSNSILNPSRRESKALPLMKTADIMPLVPLGVNNYQTLSQCYLGFDSSAKKYKVVNMFWINTRRDRTLEVGDVRYKIMTLGTDHSWRDIDSVPHQLNRFYVERQFCYVADVIYCLGKINESPYRSFRSDLPVIVAFEVRNEKFGIIPLPQGTTRIGIGYWDTGIAYSIQVGEHLGLIDTRVTTIWILEDYTKQVWSRHSIILPSCYTADKSKVSLTPVGTIHTGEILIKASSRLSGLSELPSSRLSELSELLYYNLGRKTLRVCKLSELSLDVMTHCLHLTKHVESLFKLKGI